MENLLYKHEKPLFIILAIIAFIFWSIVIIGTVGLSLIYILMIYVFYLFAHSALISYIKGTGIRISPEQFPDIYTQLESCCEKLQITTIPETYILHADGAFNAFATRFLSRNFIVLFSDVVDALKDNPAALSFYIGHELGHIHRKHLVWGPILFPGAILPLIGAAYSRAREYTCDNYGFACCEDPKSAVAGLVVLASGPQRWKSIKVNKYVEQTQETGGFWMSYNELIADYPWLVKRTARIFAKATGKPVPAPRRHGFAWFLACFTPRTMAGTGAGSILIIVAIIGMMAAIAIPQFMAYRNRAMSAAMMNSFQESPYEDTEDYEPSQVNVSPEMNSVVVEVYDKQMNHMIQNGVYSADLGALGFKSPVPDVSVQILSADEECFAGMARNAQSGETVQFDCNGIK